MIGALNNREIKYGKYSINKNKEYYKRITSFLGVMFFLLGIFNGGI